MRSDENHRRPITLSHPDDYRVFASSMRTGQLFPPTSAQSKGRANDCVPDQRLSERVHASSLSIFAEASASPSFRKVHVGIVDNMTSVLLLMVMLRTMMSGSFADGLRVRDDHSPPTIERPSDPTSTNPGPHVATYLSRDAGGSCDDASCPRQLLTTGQRGGKATR